MATNGFISYPSSSIPEELVMADSEDTAPNSSTLPRSAKRCRIPRLSRSSSMRGGDPRPKSMTLTSTPRDFLSWQAEGLLGSVPFSLDDDSSVKSFGSYASSLASQSQASSRPLSRISHFGKKYVLHCDRQHLSKVQDQEYLTPTQRKDREIRHLKSALVRQTRSCEEKERQIEGLKGELRQLQDTVTELQMGKLNLMTSSQDSDSLNVKNTTTSVISFDSSDSDRSDIQTVTLNNNNDDSGVSNVMSMSPRNSSEFDDLDASSSNKAATVDKAVGTDSVPVEETHHSSTCCSSTTIKTTEQIVVAASPRLSQEFDRFLGTYKQELEQLKSQHKEHYQDLKDKFNERVDDLLQKLTESNARYLELRPLFDRAQDKIESIETQLTDVQKEIETQDEYHNQMYLKMYRKGQEAARFEAVDDDDQFGLSKRSSVPDLLRQLRQLETELDQTKQLYREAARGLGDRQAEYTLRFLKDAVFYFLTKKDKEHLKAIQSILGFTDAERMAVAKAMKHRRLFRSPFKLKK